MLSRSVACHLERQDNYADMRRERSPSKRSLVEISCQWMNKNSSTVNSHFSAVSLPKDTCNSSGIPQESPFTERVHILNPCAIRVGFAFTLSRCKTLEPPHLPHLSKEREKKGKKEKRFLSKLWRFSLRAANIAYMANVETINWNSPLKSLCPHLGCLTLWFSLEEPIPTLVYP